MSDGFGIFARDSWPGLRAVLRRYEPGFEMPAHRDDASRISLVMRGYVLEWVSGQAVLAGPGDVVTKPGCVLHTNRFGIEPVVMLSIIHDPESGPSPAGFERASQAYAWLRKGCLSLAFRALAVTLSMPSRGADRPAAWERLRAALEGDRPRQPSAFDRVPAACDLIEMEAGSGLRVDDVARAAGVHPVYLTRLFQSAVGCTPSEYLQRARLAAAVDLLSRTGRCAADVALAAGFADQAHLCRALRRRLGVTPGVLRRRPQPAGMPALDRVAG